MTQVVPYSHADGLQVVMSGGIRTDAPVVYKVPSYEVRVEGGSVYAAVRFGLQNKRTVLKTRVCDAGISHHHVCIPTWVPGYSPHSFPGSSRPGAWQLLPGKGFLIHEGADSTKKQVGGSLGCVEILDGDWNDFLSDIERLAGRNAIAVGSKRLLTVMIEQAPFPLAALVQ
jgi:hypothetical protein